MARLPCDPARFDHPWFDPYRELICAVGWPDTDPQYGWLIRLNALASQRGLRNDAGLLIRFEPAEPMPAIRYESMIASSGVVPTRLCGDDAWHDYFNALVWLRFPAIKRQLNALQAQAIEFARTATETGLSSVVNATADVNVARPGGRGRLRDMLTLFDESAALIETDDLRCREDLRGFAWASLFVERRSAWRAGVRVSIVGHALLQKLMRPYKAICAQAWVAPREVSLEQADRTIALTLSTESLRPGCLTPLPVLGVPDWWAPNERSEFYVDTAVFRPGRQR